MENIKESCGLCLCDVRDKNFTIIEDCTKDMLDTLLLKTNVEEKTSIICGVCSEKLFAAFNFKTTCLHTENIIKTYVCEEGFPIDIGEIYLKEIENKQLINMSENSKVCRLCMELVTDEFLSVQEINTGIFKKYIPEINLDSIKDPVTCKTCFKSFLVYSNFLENCSKAHQTFTESNKSIETVYIKTESIKTENIEESIKVESSEKGAVKFEDCYSDTRVLNVFQSEAEIYKCKLCGYEAKHKRELLHHELTHNDNADVEGYECKDCDFHTKHKDTFVSHLLGHRPKPVVKWYSCPDCDYRTKYNAHLKRHLLRHKDKSEVNTYECNECDFRTKHKNNLSTHLLLRHSNESAVEWHECGECDFKTKHKPHLKRHRLTHVTSSETKMYECGECVFRTKHKHNLTSHRLTHRKDAGVTWLSCTECAYKTRYKNNLKRHLLVHSSEVKNERKE